MKNVALTLCAAKASKTKLVPVFGPSSNVKYIYFLFVEDFARDELSGDDKSWDELFEDELFGDEISRDDLSRDELCRNELSGDEISEDELFSDELSGNEPFDLRNSGTLIWIGNFESPFASFFHNSLGSGMERIQ